MPVCVGCKLQNYSFCKQTQLDGWASHQVGLELFWQGVMVALPPYVIFQGESFCKVMETYVIAIMFSVNGCDYAIKKQKLMIYL